MMAAESPCIEYRIVATLLMSKPHDMKIVDLAIALGVESSSRYSASRYVRQVCQRIERDGLVECWRNGTGSPRYVRLLQHSPT